MGLGWMSQRLKSAISKGYHHENQPEANRWVQLFLSITNPNPNPIPTETFAMADLPDGSPLTWQSTATPNDSRRSFGTCWHDNFTDQMSFLSPNQKWCQSKQGISKMGCVSRQ